MLLRRGAWVLAVAVLATSTWALLPLDVEAESPRAGCAGDPAKSDLAEGEGTIAITEREVVVIGSKREGCVYQRSATKNGYVRHLATRRGQGTVYVDDRVGADTLVVVTDQGVERIAGDGEIVHPTWSPDGRVAWAEDFARVRVIDTEDGDEETVDAPARVSGVFSPVFTGRDSIVAVAQEPIGRFRELTEDDMLNNLWSYDETAGSWTRLTDFEVTGDEWSVIRTPVASESGDVLFVRIHGHAFETKEPRFELWMLSGGESRKIRDLPGEMFLAGMRNGRLMWNVFSSTCGDWELLVEDPDEGLAHLGCGAVMVDPTNIADVDLLVEEEGRRATTTVEDGIDAHVGVVIGDFQRRRQAARVAAGLSGASVVTNSDAPAAVRPGAYAVAIEVGGDPDAALREVKRSVPELKHMVFLAPLDKLAP